MRLLLIVLAVFAVAMLVCAWFLATRYAPQPGAASRRVPCALRAGHRGWSVGTLSYEADRLVYRTRTSGLRHRERHWQRAGLEVGIGKALDGAEVGARWRDREAVVVACTYGDESFELAISEGRYTALRSWVEAVPPGWNANVS